MANILAQIIKIQQSQIAAMRLLMIPLLRELLVLIIGVQFLMVMVVTLQQ